MNYRGSENSEEELPTRRNPLKVVLKMFFSKRKKRQNEGSTVLMSDLSDSFLYKSHPSTNFNGTVTSQKDGRATSSSNVLIPKASNVEVKIHVDHSKRKIEDGHSSFSTDVKAFINKEENATNDQEGSTVPMPDLPDSFLYKSHSSTNFNGTVTSQKDGRATSSSNLLIPKASNVEVKIHVDHLKRKIEDGHSSFSTDVKTFINKEENATNDQEGTDQKIYVNICDLAERAKRRSLVVRKSAEPIETKLIPQRGNRVAELVKVFEEPVKKFNDEKRPSLLTNLSQVSGQPPVKPYRRKLFDSSLSNESTNKRIENHSRQVSQSHVPPVVPKKKLDIALNPPNDVQVSSVVHQLVMTKYEEALYSIRQCRINRKPRKSYMDSCGNLSSRTKTENNTLDKPSDSRNNFSNDLDGHRYDGKPMYTEEKTVGKADFNGTSIDIGLNQSCEILESKRNPFNILNDTRESKKRSFDALDCPETNESTSGFDQQKFLREALGEELMNLSSSTENSNCDQTKYTNGQFNYEFSRQTWDRRHVEKGKSRATIPKQITDSNSNHAVTEKKYNYMEYNKKRKLMNEIDIQNKIIYQLSKALLVCRSQSKYIDQDIRIEAEKKILVETCKKERMEEELKKQLPVNKNNSNSSIAITIKNLNFSRAIVLSNSYCKKYSWFFVCVLESGTTVLASKVIKPEANEILFSESFQFEGHPSDFVITIKLFALGLKNIKKEKRGLDMKMFPNMSPNYAPTHSFFTFWGKTEINPVKFSKHERHCLTLTDIPYKASLSNTFGAEVETLVKLPVVKKGYLTIGVEEFNRLPTWKHRWCVLDGCKLKYWNHPFEEQLIKPLGELNLMDAYSQQLKVVKKDICPWPQRSFSLEMKVEGKRQPVKEYFLVAHTEKELEEWRSNLNLVFENLRR